MTKLPKIILKLDDAGFEGKQVHPGWQQTIAFLDDLGIPSAIGVIGRSLETPSAAFLDWLRGCRDSGHEIWNHGYYHSRPEEARPSDGRKGAEFRGMGLAFQIDAMLRTQDLLKKRLGITARVFGAPFNATDQVTVDALKRIPELGIWLFKETSVKVEAFVFPRIEEVNIEYPVHVPDFERFKAGYLNHLDKDVLVIQGHPRSWTEDAARFEKFRQIVTYLTDYGAQFTTPTAYVENH